MSDSNADRNLLFGILALHLNFVTQDDLMAAMNAWIADKSQPIGRIMLQQDVLNDDHLELLEALVEKHLQLHENDATKSLAAISSVDEEAVGNLTRMGDTQVTESLVHVTPGAKTRSPDETMPITDAADSAAPAAADQTRKLDDSGIRFRVLRPHAHGGLGQVSVARDEELHREVAFKELHDRHANNPNSRSRFLLEAEVTGALEHPGIVPIYGLGQYGDGRPFYAMRFIRGDSLGEALDRFHQPEVEHCDPGERELAFRKLLSRFVDVCNAMHYAHSRGVLHRDLKPGNIMLGKYGETLVVDWGLAKPMHMDTTEIDSDESSVQLSSDSLSSPTLMGSVVGTPQYMSPEQASGNLEKVGTAADIYGLGATLFCLLTGKPPFEADDIGRLLRMVREGDFAEPREVNSATPAALNAICMKAMALDPQDRYATPNELAEDIEHWLADEPVSVHQETPIERAGRWARHNRSWVAAAAAALVLVTVVSIVAALFINQARGEEKRQKEIAERARRDEQQQRQQAEKAQRRAEKNFQIASGAVDEMLYAVGTEHLADAPQMQQVRRVLLSRALDYYDQFRQQAGTDDARYRLQVALANHNAAYILHTIRDRQDEAETLFRTAIAQLAELDKQFPKEPTYRRHLADSWNWLGELFRPTDPDQALAAYAAAIQIQREIVDKHPGMPQVQREFARSLMNRGIILAEQGAFLEAKTAYDQAVRLLESLPDQPSASAARLQELARSLNNRGKLLSENEQPTAAIADYRRAVDAIERALQQDQYNREYQQEHATYLNNLANLLRESGELPLAVDTNRRAVAAWKSLAAPVGRIGDELANSYNSLGAILQQQSRDERDETAQADLRRRATEVYADSARLFHELIEQAPGEASLQDRLGNALYNRATILFDEAQYPLAADLLAQAITAHQQAGKLSPDSPAYRTHLRNDYWFLAELSLKTGNHAGAAQAAEQLPPLFPEKPNEYLRAARFLARCVESAANDEGSDEAMREMWREKYGKRAVELLRQAIERDFDDFESLKKTKDEKGPFYMLHERADFQQLLGPCP